MKVITFTKNGFEDIQKQYNELKHKRLSVVKELSDARDLGDRSENAAYKVARQKLSALDRRIVHLGYLLRVGKVVEPQSTDKVEIGSQVTFQDETDKTVTFTIVGGYESNIPEGKLSEVSPIGKALLGKKKGEIVKVHIPDGIKHYKIIEVKNV